MEDISTIEPEDIVCNCFQVTRKEIEDAIDGGASTVEEVGEATNAGTGCGGCQGKIRAILHAKGK